MNMMPYEHPDGYYDERLLPIDEQICELMQRRKELTHGNPGEPHKAALEEWAEKYGFYEQFLYSVFNTMNAEAIYKPRVKPENFRQQIPVMRSAEQEGVFYLIATMRQYENASVVVLSADWEELDLLPEDFDHPRRRSYKQLALQIRGGKAYDCREDSGVGTLGKMSQNYIISPSLPDDLSGIEFCVQAYDGLRNAKTVGPEVVLK